MRLSSLQKNRPALLVAAAGALICGWQLRRVAVELGPLALAVVLGMMAGVYFLTREHYESVEESTVTPEAESKRTVTPAVKSEKTPVVPTAKDEESPRTGDVTADEAPTAQMVPARALTEQRSELDLLQEKHARLQLSYEQLQAELSAERKVFEHYVSDSVDRLPEQ